MGQRSNYDWMLFLTSPMAFVRAQTHDSVLIKQMIYITPRPRLLHVIYMIAYDYTILRHIITIWISNCSSIRKIYKSIKI